MKVAKQFEAVISRSTRKAQKMQGNVVKVLEFVVFSQNFNKCL